MTNEPPTAEAVCATCGHHHDDHAIRGQAGASRSMCHACALKSPRDNAAFHAFAEPAADAVAAALGQIAAYLLAPDVASHAAAIKALDQIRLLLAATQAEAPRVAELEAALRDMLDWAENPPLGESKSFDDDMQDYEARQLRARRALAPSPKEGGE